MAFQSLVQIFRDFVVDGVPSSGKNKPKKSDIRSWGAWVESILNAAGNNVGTVYQTRSALFGDLTKPANTMAWVTNDTTASYNGIYQKLGAINTGSWTRVADLPYSFIQAQNAGAGSANALQATTTMPISSTALVVLPIAVTNTGSPVTVSFNGASALTIKSNSGNDIVSGGLTTGMYVFGVVIGSTFRILNDQVSAAIVAAAESAAADAVSAKNAAAASAAGVNLPGIVANDAFKILTPKVDGSGHQIYASYRETMRRMKQSAIRGRAYWAGHNNPLVGTAAVNSGSTSAGRTLVHAPVTRAIAQDGYIRKVSVYVFANGNDASNNFKLLILRPNGASYNVIDTSDAILIGSGTGIKTFELPRPIGPAWMGDFVGIWMSGATSGPLTWTIAANAGNSVKLTNSLAVGGETYTTSTDADMCLFAMGSTPIIVTHGDSIIAGHNGGAGHWWNTRQDGTGPTGERDSDPMYQAIARSGLNLVGLDYQNNGKGSTTWADQAALISNWTYGSAAENKLAPKIVLLHCGVNDVAAGRTWAAIEKDMYSVLALLSNVDRLFISEIAPYTAGNDTMAANIRAFNANYATWCANNGAVLVPIHDALGKTRVSTGQLDDLNYDAGDGTHLSKTGVDVYAKIIAQTVLGTLI
jgi:lysophospholipase L1-like esterase